ncbi:MAG: hypothetical protein FWD76_01030, partial [Firmicutes bacterium]|nr:hypothetical protein [Bacillota bacterium]
MQKSIVEKKFDKLTKDAYAFLRLVGVEYNTFAKTAEYAFLYPESFAQQVAKGQAVIETALQKVLASPLFANSFCFTGSHFDAKIFETRFFEMLKAHPSIASDVTKERLSLSQKDGKILVTLKLESSVWEYAKSEKVNFAGQIKDQLYYQYCEEFEIVLQDRGIDHKARQDNVLRVGQDTTAQLEREGGREIVVSGVEILVGKLDTFAKSIPKMAVGKVGERAGGLEQGDDHGEQILDTTLCATAQYIVDCKDTPKKSVVVCGDVAFFEVAVSKAGKTYVKLELNDKTSTLKGMFFPKSNQMEQLSPLLQDGQFVYGTQLLVSGEIKPDTLRNDGSTTFFVNNIAKCVLPKDFV